ncbi:zinc metalloprotease HtpX [Allonocardiopsis opalescens]|uniref:Protease HtpX homolog n=1 Tax=Allonocardiopsis opalescens TaxID=1144618 RepID=A0A2T0PZT1_9ACTN|nr:zinc metalloprotease HtpX [Allonocardiopsis opalescens]PRX97061.1 heat shock protein HtpX [Allonocardiopsis opalescens]
MARTRFAADRGLTNRMLTTMFLLGLVYVVFIAAMVAAGVQWWLILLVVVGFFLFQFFGSERMALYSMNARVVSPEEAPALHGVVDRLCAMADMPKPKVAIAHSDMPNAFATGHSRKKALVCVTTGLLRRLEPERDPAELEAVLAHELSHVAHRDVAVMTIASTLGILAGFVSRFALQFAFVGGRGNNNNGGALLGLAVILVSAIVYAVSFLLIRVLSRYRELAADRGAAQLTGRPSALASALTKISGEMGRIPTGDLRKAEPINAFFLVPAFAKRRGISLAQLFATHPPLEQRLEQLARISADLGRGA